MAKQQTVFDQLRAVALSYPESHEDNPWGETAIKVRGKIFVFMAADNGEMRITVKLPRSKEFALDYPFTKPSGYGLGKAGWVTATFALTEKPPMDVLTFWIDESYRAVAPKKLSATAPEQKRTD